MNSYKSHVLFHLIRFVPMFVLTRIILTAEPFRFLVSLPKHRVSNPPPLQPATAAACKHARASRQSKIETFEKMPSRNELTHYTSDKFIYRHVPQQRRDVLFFFLFFFLTIITRTHSRCSTSSYYYAGGDTNSQ